MRIVNASFLQPKKLYIRDKLRADTLMREYLCVFANQHALGINEELASQLVTQPSTRRSSAYLTYGHWLIKRLAGESDGPSILALWRLVAWDPRGGMRRGFTIELEYFKAAESDLLTALKVPS